MSRIQDIIISKNINYEFFSSDEWDNLANYITYQENRKVIICGGKGVGKSTLLRYLVNKSLDKYPEVLVIDLDPGQSEFTIMGCLSATVITNPILGPNYAHLLTPTKCLYFGDISVTNYSELYKDCVKNIISFCNSQSFNIPWFVNTMGFTKDLGIKLLSNILYLMQPTDVIQINCDKLNIDFPQCISPDFIQNNQHIENYSLKYKLHVVASISLKSRKNSDICGLDSASKRNIVTLSYFKPILKCNSYYNVCEAIPYKFDLNELSIVINKLDSRNIKIMNLHQKLNCINGSLVALCTSEVENSIPHCKGFGIIRGFDLETMHIFIATPLNTHQLKCINEIHFSSTIQLPQIIYKNQIFSSEHKIPYITHKRASKMNKLIKKTNSRVKMCSAV